MKPNGDACIIIKNKTIYTRSITLIIGKYEDMNERTTIEIVLKIGRFNNIRNVLEGRQRTAYLSSDAEENTTFILRRNIKMKTYDNIEKESSKDEVSDDKSKDDIFIIEDQKGISYLKSWKITRNNLEYILYSMSINQTSLILLDNPQEDLYVSDKHIKIKNYFGSFRIRLINVIPLEQKARPLLGQYRIYREGREGVLIHGSGSLTPVQIYSPSINILLPRKYSLLLVDSIYY